MISVYGSSGFIGSNFCRSYTNECEKIHRNDNTAKSNNILYFISTVDNYNIHTDPYLDIETNLTKLIGVLEECKKLNNKEIVFNFISSWFVYGKTPSIPANENSICNPTGFYSITKYAAERMLASYCNTFGIKYRILRLTNIIGPGDKKASKKRNAVQYMIGCLKDNKPIEIYQDGFSTRDFMDVDDCCRAIKLCIDSVPFNEIINISNSEPKTIKEIIDYAKEKLNSKSDIQSISAPEFHKTVQIKNMWLDNKKLLSYGYIPKTRVLESVDRIIEAL